MALVTAAGARLFVADPGPLSPDPSWVEVDEVTNYGDFGPKFAKIAFESITNRLVRKYKGTRDDGTLQLNLGRNTSDNGQAKLRTASLSDDDYNFKIELNDVTVGFSVPTTFKFKAQVMSYTTKLTGPNSIVGSTCDLEIQSGTIEEVDVH